MRHLLALLCLAALADAKPPVKSPVRAVAPKAFAPPRGPAKATSGTINCGVWGTCTAVVQQAETRFDDAGNPLKMLIMGKLLDQLTPPQERGRFRLIYDYATGLVTDAGSPLAVYTETAGHQTTINNAGSIPPLIAQSALASISCPGVASCAVTLVRPQ